MRDDRGDEHPPDPRKFSYWQDVIYATRTDVAPIGMIEDFAYDLFNFEEYLPEFEE